MDIRWARHSRSSREAAAVSAEPQEGSDRPPLSSMPGATNYRDTRKPGLSPAEIGTIASLGAGPFIVGAEGLGAGRKTANSWNQSFHDPMMAKFNTISTPEQLLDWWQEYLTGASNFATGGTGDFNSAKVRMSKNYTVIAQALLKTPGFLQALDAKWQQVGGPGKYGLPSLSSTMMSTQGGNGPRIFQSDVGATIQTALDQIGYWRNVINLPGAKDEPEPAPPGARPDLSNVSDKPPTQPPGQTPPVTKVPGAPDLTK